MLADFNVPAGRTEIAVAQHSDALTYTCFWKVIQKHCGRLSIILSLLIQTVKILGEYTRQFLQKFAQVINIL